LADPKRRRGPEGRMALYLVVGYRAHWNRWRALETPWWRPVAARSRSSALAHRGRPGDGSGGTPGAPRAAPWSRSRCADALIIDWANPGPGAWRFAFRNYPRRRHGHRLRRDAAARFSFLLSIPAVAACGSSSFPSCCTITTWESRPCSLAWPLLACQDIVHSMALALPPKRTTYSFVIYRVALGLSLLPLFSRGSWREAPSVPLRRPPCGGLPTPPARAASHAARRGHDLLRPSPQGHNSYLDRSGRIGYLVFLLTRTFRKLGP